MEKDWNKVYFLWYYYFLFFAAGQLKNVGHTSTVALLPHGQDGQANIKVSSLTFNSSYYYYSSEPNFKHYLLLELSS